MKPLFLLTVLTLCAACMPVVEERPAPTFAALPANVADRDAQIVALAAAIRQRPIEGGRDVCIGAWDGGRTASPDSSFLATVDSQRKLFAIGHCPPYTVRDTLVMQYGGFRRGYEFDRWIHRSPLVITVTGVADRRADARVVAILREERSYYYWTYTCVVLGMAPRLTVDCTEGTILS